MPWGGEEKSLCFVILDLSYDYREEEGGFRAKIKNEMEPKTI